MHDALAIATEAVSIRDDVTPLCAQDARSYLDVIAARRVRDEPDSAEAESAQPGQVERPRQHRRRSSPPQTCPWPPSWQGARLARLAARLARRGEPEPTPVTPSGARSWPAPASKGQRRWSGSTGRAPRRPSTRRGAITTRRKPPARSSALGGPQLSPSSPTRSRPASMNGLAPVGCRCGTVRRRRRSQIEMVRVSPGYVVARNVRPWSENASGPNRNTLWSKARP